MESLKKIARKIPTWVASALCLAAILWLTLSPEPVGAADLPLFPGADKLVHAVLFGGFTLTLCFDFAKWRGGKRFISGLYLCIAVIISSATGILREILQRAMSLGRSFEIADIFADISGAIIATVIIAIYLRYYNSSSH